MGLKRLSLSRKTNKFALDLDKTAGKKLENLNWHEAFLVDDDDSPFEVFDDRRFRQDEESADFRPEKFADEGLARPRKELFQSGRNFL